MRPKVLNASEENLIGLTLTINKELHGFIKQKQQIEAVVNGTHDLIKSLKTNKKNIVTIVRPGNILWDEDKKIVIKNNLDQLQRHQNALKGVDGQITLREDSIVEHMLKLHTVVESWLKIRNIEIPVFDYSPEKGEIPSIEGVKK